MQIYHSSWIILLLLTPVSGDALDVYRSVQSGAIFHARRILSIASTSRMDTRSVVNSILAYYIAARVVRRHEERSIIIDLLSEAEKRTGWATKWRIDILRDEWEEYK